MLEAASVRDFERSPVGRFTSTASCVVWCASPTLVGWHVWDRPGERETRTLLQLLAQYPKLEPRFDVVADTRGIEVVNPTALAVLVPWVLQHRRALRERVRMQANVIRRDSVGFLLMGVLASVGDIHPFRTYAEPREAFRSVAGDQGAALCDEVEAIVQSVRGVPPELQSLRTLLAANVDARIEDAAKEPRDLTALPPARARKVRDVLPRRADARALRRGEPPPRVERREGRPRRGARRVVRADPHVGLPARTGETPRSSRRRASG